MTKIKNVVGQDNIHETIVATFENQNEIKRVKKRKTAKKEEITESKKSIFGRKVQQRNHIIKVANTQDQEADDKKNNLMILFAWGK